MSTRYSLAQRTALQNSLFAALACAATLTLTAGPALAQAEELARVEVRGRIVESVPRYDVQAACEDFQSQLQSMLHSVWANEARYGEVQVQFVMDNGSPESVEASGISPRVARGVRNAVSRLRCGDAALAAQAQIYRFTVDFVSPWADLQPQSALAAKGRVRVAMAR